MNGPRLPAAPSDRPARKRQSTDRSLTVFLVLTVLDVFVLKPLISATEAGDALVEIVFSLALVAGTVQAVNRNRHTARVSILLIVATICVRWLHRLGIVPGLDTTAIVLTTALLGWLVLLILIEVFRPGAVTTERILGAVAVYVLQALIWAHAYLLLETLIPGAVQVPGEDARPLPLSWSMVHFSLSTLTTVGDGNVTLNHPIAQSMSMAEAMLGQLYPAILIGRLVGAWSVGPVDE